MEASLKNKTCPLNLGVGVSIRGSVVDVGFENCLPPILLDTAWGAGEIYSYHGIDTGINSPVARGR